MPLEMIELRDPRSFWIAYADAIAIPNQIASGTFAVPGDGIAPLNGMGHTEGSGDKQPGYKHLSDEIFWFSSALIRDGVKLYEQSALRADSQLINSAQGMYRDNWTPNTAANRNIHRFYAGQPLLQSGVQNMYGYSNITTNPVLGWFIMDPSNLNYIKEAIFKLYIPEASTLAITNDGYFTGTGYDGSYTGTVRNIILFEGMTDSSGFADVTDGGTSLHANGLALQKATACQLSTVSIGEAWIWVDIATGNAVGFLDIPVDTTASGDQQSEGLIDGEGFGWNRCQFVPDSDSLDAQPKGELHFYSTVSDDRVTASGVLPDDAATAFTGWRSYVSVYDFNPFGLTTGTERIHARRVFLGAMDIPGTPSSPGGPNVDPATLGSTFQSTMFFHQPSNTYFLWGGNVVSNIGTNPVAVIPEQDDLVMYRWKRAVQVAEITSSPTSVVATNKTVRHQAAVVGEFGTVGSGIAVTATLSRVSTYEEQFDTVTATDVVVLEAGVIDDNETLEVYEGTVASGTLLTETTNYTFVAATGTITGVNFTTSTTHSVVYQHRSVPLTPAHGALLNASTTSDGNGVAFFDVQYADDATLEDMIDELTITEV